MRGLRRNVLGLVVAGCGGCQLVAGIENLQLTDAGADATTGDASSEASADAPSATDATDSPSGADGLGGEGGADAPMDGHADGGADASADSPADSPAGVDAGEAGLTYAQEVMLDQPLAYWRFGEASGTTAVDSSGHGNNGEYVGDVTLGALGAIASDPNTAVGFDGATAFMDAGNVFAFTGMTPCSFEAWVNPILDDGYHEVLSRSDGQGSTTTGYLMYIEPQSSPAMMDFALYVAGVGNIAESDSTIDGGVYTHLVGVYDGSNITLYGNGAVLKHVTTSYSIPATVDPFVVAAQSGGMTGWFHGAIDEVAVYGAALPASRILVHYRVGIGLPPE